MYIDSGTFWIFIILLGVGIGVTYYLLNKRVKANEQTTATLYKALDKITKAIDQEFVDVRNEAHRNSAEIYNNVADAIESLETKSNKKSKKK